MDNARVRLSGRQILTKRSKLLLIAVVLALVGFTAPAGDSNTLFASQIGTLTVSPAHTGLDSEVTVSVFDSDLNVTVLREFEATDSTSNLYELPVGNSGETTVFKLQNSSVGDFNADGVVDASDIQISTTNAAVQWVSKDSGSFQLIHTTDTSVAENFTVTYRSEHHDTTTVTLRSPSDPAGFTLTLRESTPTSHTFTATFKTGAATSTTGATDPTSSTRPVIKVVDGDSITLEYADLSPAKLISESVVVDNTKPSVSVTSPIHNSSSSNASVWARAVITDSASGVALDQIKFHVDVDRDNVFDEPGEIVTASATESVVINQGWNAAVLLPAISTNGLVNWYVTATDRAGNKGVSDSEATAGEQFHKFTVDTSPPSLKEVVLGEAWDATDEVIVGNVLNAVKVQWSEEIKESSIDPTRFIIDGQSAKTATMVEDVKDTVWLTFEEIPTWSEKILIKPGAVSDLTDFPSELKELKPIDKLGPRLKVSTDTAVTNGLLTINIKTVEPLIADPTVTINGVTFGSASSIDINEWSINVDGNTFTGAAAGDGVKNIEAAGFDAALNIARGGVPVEAADYPTGAVQFQLDRTIQAPVIVPGEREIALVPRPLITVSFADEIGEYAGDTHAGVTIISAKLNGEDITSQFSAESASTWSYRPGDLINTEHVLVILGRDDAGNTHSPITRVFSVDAPEPTPTPIPTETPTPAPTVEVPEAVDPAPTEVPSDSSEVASATPEPVESPEPETVPEQSVEPSESEEPVASEPVTDPEPENVEPVAAPEDAPPADPESVPEPSESDTPAEDSNEPVADADGEPPAEGNSEEDGPVTEEDIAATVAAMRAADEEAEATEGEGDADPSLAPEPALTVFGCNVPTGGDEAVGAVTAGADYMLAAAGLFGLIVARVRPKRRKPLN